MSDNDQRVLEHIDALLTDADEDTIRAVFAMVSDRLDALEDAQEEEEVEQAYAESPTHASAQAVEPERQTAPELPDDTPEQGPDDPDTVPLEDTKPVA